MASISALISFSDASDNKICLPSESISGSSIASNSAFLAANSSGVFFYGENSANVAGGGFVALNGDITPTGGGGVSTPEPRGIVSLIAVGALGVASLRRRG